MPDWHAILDELEEAGSTHDVIRRKYLSRLHGVTGRNVILYYSGWLQKPDVAGVQVNDADKNGFMTVIHKMDRSRGLDIILHTPGGETAATESIVSWRVETARPIIAKVHKPGKAKADPLRGLFEATVEGKPSIVE